MKTYLDCFPCILKQTLDAARVATEDAARQREILNAVMMLLTEVEEDRTPPQIAQKAHRLIREISGHPDPYAAKKREYNERALTLLPQLRAMVEEAEDSLELAVRLAIAGNVVDFGATGGNFDFDREWREADRAESGVFDYEAFQSDIPKADSILYLGDNAGEIVFDRLLIEQTQRRSKARVTFVVRGEPVLNDATLEDARFAGLDRLVDVIANASDAPATILSEVDPQVRRLYESADMIIAKGQGNYETLSEAEGNLYFLFQVKCPVVARDTGAEIGKYMLLHSRRR